MKECCKCGVSKPLSEFPPRKNSIDGYQNFCKECKKKYDKEYQIKNKERTQAQRKRYREENHDKIRKQDNLYKLKNKEVLKKKNKEYRDKNKEKRNKYNREYLKENSQASTLCKLRSKLATILSLKTFEKQNEFKELIGCSSNQLKNYIESLFLEGMDWDNHGRFGWHIDHIKPCILFDLTDPVQQKECFHYTNLQPLWCYNNYSKGGRTV